MLRLTEALHGLVSLFGIGLSSFKSSIVAVLEEHFMYIMSGDNKTKLLDASPKLI